MTEPFRRLSARERALWTWQTAVPDGGVPNEALAVSVDGRLVVPALTRALRQVLGRQPTLRTRFPVLGEEPAAVVVPPERATVGVPVRSGTTHGLWFHDVSAIAGGPFDLAHELPVRVAVLRAPVADTLILVLHQLVTERVTLSQLYQDLSVCYPAGTTGPPELAGDAPDPEPSSGAESASAYWRTRLAGIRRPPAGLAIGQPDPARPTFAGAMMSQTLGPPARVAIRALARQVRTTEELVMLTGYVALLARHGAAPDLVVGARVAPGDPPAGVPTGSPAYVLPIRIHVDLAESWIQLAARVQDAVREAVAHQAPYEAVLPGRELSGDGQWAPLFRYGYTYHSLPGLLRFGDLPATVGPVDTGYSQRDLALEVHTGRTRTELRLRYRTEIHEPDDVRALLLRFENLLCHARAGSEQPLGELSWWSSADRAVVAGGHRAADRPLEILAVEDEHGRQLPPGIPGRLRLGTHRSGERARWRHCGQLERLAAPAAEASPAQPGRPAARAAGPQRIAVLAGESLQRAGGQAMRWQALHTALGRYADCSLRQLGCDRWKECRSTCRLTGRPGRDDDVTYWDEAHAWTFERRYCPAYASQLERELLAAGVSTVVCSGLETSRYVRELTRSGRLTVVFDMHNVELALHRTIHHAAPAGSHYAEVYTERHLALVGKAERAAVTAADEVWVCSPQDRELVTALYGETMTERTVVVPNVVDLPGHPPVLPDCRRICFTGRMDYYPNTAAGEMLGRKIAPLLRGQGHDLPIVLAGARAGDAFGGLALPPGVDLVSDPASVADLLVGSIMAVPLSIGSGTRFKVLEAFGSGAPVVSTGKGVEGLALVPDVHYLRAESAAEFADSLDLLIRDPDRRTQLCQAAWKLVRDRYSIDALVRQFGEMARLRHVG